MSQGTGEAAGPALAAAAEGGFEAGMATEPPPKHPERGSPARDTRVPGVGLLLWLYPDPSPTGWRGCGLLGVCAKALQGPAGAPHHFLHPAGVLPPQPRDTQSPWSWLESGAAPRSSGVAAHPRAR